MADSALTADQVVRAAEDALRRYGPGKATVVDVARALGVSHGSVYRHFATKAALRAEVTRRWLDRAHAGLAAIAESAEPAPQRLDSWLRALVAAKRRKAFDDPELFATYTAIALESKDVVAEHLADLVGQVSRIIADGVAAGEFRPVDPAAASRAVFDATMRFHNPVHVREWTSPTIDAEFDAVRGMLLAGLRATP